MKILVFGSRTINDYKQVEDHLYNMYNQFIDEGDDCSLISGGAIGVDTLAERFAKEYEVDIEVYKPNYTKYGKKAPLIRNKKMAELCDKAICFWDGQSRGTMHTLMMLAQMGKETTIYGKKEVR